MWEQRLLIRDRNRRIVLAVLCGLPLIPVGHSVGQPSRLRTFVYEPKRKEWLEPPPPAPGTSEADLYAIRAWIKEGKERKALRAIKKLRKQVGESHTLLPHLLIAKAEAQIGRRRYYQAHLTLQEFLSRFAGMALTSDALRLEFVIAETFLAGVKQRWLGIPLFSGKDTAFGILDEIAADYADNRLAELAIKTTADQMFDEGDHALAELEYGRLLREYPQSRYAQFALRRLAEAALAGFGGTHYDEAPLIEAEERYHDYQLRYRAADREGVGLILDSLREMRAEKDYSVGAYYERSGHLSSAVFYYELVGKDWPGTIAQTKAASRLELLGVSQPVRSPDDSSGAFEAASGGGTSNR